MLLFN